jgi:hypothetical protein
MQMLTRQELYDLVWSKPIIKLAQEFGLSDVGLAKICERHRVPTPPRGYWAKKEAGKKVKQTIFVHVDDPLLDRIEVSPHRENLPEPVREIVEQRRAERKMLTQPARPVIMTPPTTDPREESHPAIQATAKALRRAKPSKLDVVEAIGPGLCGISIGTRSVERIISILDRLARACDTRGVTLLPADTRLSAAVVQDTITFEIKEKTKQVPHVLTEAEIAEEEKRKKRNQRWARGPVKWNDVDVFAPSPPKFDTVRTGDLGLEVHGWGDGLRRSWRDGKTQVLETLICEIVDGLEAHIVTTRIRREKREREEAERKELDRRRGLAKARRERECERKVLLNKLIRTERRVVQLRDWIESYEGKVMKGADPHLSRMI